MSPKNAKLNSSNETYEIAEELLKLEQNLSAQLSNLQFGESVKYVYDPTEHAFELHAQFIRKFCKYGPKEVLMLGINPGPFGMVQTGVPFGEISIVREWFLLDGNVGKPHVECPKRPVVGLSCTKSEVSGRRFWGLFKQISNNPYTFFQHCYVHNYCPLTFMKENGNNIVPNELPKTFPRKELEKHCDNLLMEIIKLLKVEIIVCVGRYPEERCRKVNASIDKRPSILYLSHPSARNQQKETSWDTGAKQFLLDNNLMSYFEKR